MMRSTSRAFAHSLGFGVAAIAVLPGMAMAQTNAPATTDDSINEIVVTAQKRAENVQDIPKSVEVLSSKALLDAGINNVQDLARLSPSIQGTGGQGTENSPPAIRGIASFAYSIGVQSQTGIVLDDIPQPNFSTLANELSDVERVEILPGPQSTLSGRNAAGGLINVVTRSPSSTLKANLTAEVTDDHQKRFAGYITGPVSDTVGFSLSGFWNDWDGPLYNRATGNRIGGYDRFGFRGKLKWQPTDRLTATVTGFYVENKAPTVSLTGSYAYSTLAPDTQSYFVPVPLQTLLGFAPGAYNHDVYSDYEGQTRTKDYGGSLRLDYDTDIGTISSISSISRSDNATTNPLVGFAVAFPNLPVIQNYTVNYKTQELRLTSPTGNSRLQYTLGAIYTDTKINEPYSRPVIAPVNWDRTAVTRSIALYGRATYEVVPSTFLTGGLRYQHDYQAYDWQFHVAATGDSERRASGSSKYDFVAGEASLRHEFGRHVSAYATYANAQTGKAYDLEDNASALSASGLQPLASEKVQSYEAGLKTQWLNNRLTLNVAVFNADYKNYQIQSAFQPDITQPATIRLFSIGRVRTRGIELSGSYAVTKDLRLSAAATWMDAEIRDYPNPICYGGQTDQASCVAGNPAYTGQQANLGGTDMPGASHFKVMGNAAYTLHLRTLPFDMTFNAQGRYQSSNHSFVLNDPVSFIRPFGTVNLAVGLQDHDAKYKLQFFVNNVFDKQYYSTLTRDTVTFSPSGANPTAVSATYARDSRRYGGLRLTIDY